MPDRNQTTMRCTCGDVEIEVTGQPILVTACYCDDCQKAARQLEPLPGAPSVMGSDGGTEMVLFRKDRMRCVKGSEHLRDHRIDEASATRRVLATCCNAAMFLDFQKGHWFSLYRVRFGDNAPPVQMRIQTRYRPADSSDPGDVPEYESYPLKFMTKLLAARIGMLFS